MKYIFTLVFFTSSFFLFSQAEFIVNTELLNVRSGPSTDYEVIGQIELDQRIIEVSKSGSWSEIQADNLRGYVSSKYITRLKNDENEEEDDSSFIGALIILGIIGYVIYRIKNFFSSLFGGGTKSSRPMKRKSSSRPSSTVSSTSFKQPKIKINPLIADVKIKSNNYLDTYDENGKRISGMFLNSNETFVGFSQNGFVTVKSNNYLTTYNANCKRIAGMFLNSNESFRAIAGNNFTTKKTNNYLTTYDLNCKRISGRFA